MTATTKQLVPRRASRRRFVAFPPHPNHPPMCPTFQACALLATMSTESSANQRAVREQGGVEALVRVVGAGGEAAAAHAAAALGHLCYANLANQDAVRHAGGIEPLVALLHQRKDSPLSRTTFGLDSLFSKKCGRASFVSP